MGRRSRRCDLSSSCPYTSSGLPPNASSIMVTPWGKWPLLWGWWGCARLCMRAEPLAGRPTNSCHTAIEEAHRTWPTTCTCSCARLWCISRPTPCHHTLFVTRWKAYPIYTPARWTLPEVDMIFRCSTRNTDILMHGSRIFAAVIGKGSGNDLPTIIDIAHDNRPFLVQKFSSLTKAPYSLWRGRDRGGRDCYRTGCLQRSRRGG